MKIIEAPYETNTDAQLRNKILKECSVCPCCGETRKSEIINGALCGIHARLGNQWYGRRSEYEHPILGLFKFQEPLTYWETTIFSCYSCGAVWESDPYPMSPSIKYPII